MGRDKAMIEIDGRPLVVHVAEILGRAAHPVLLAPGRRGRLGDLGYEEVDDSRPGSGPIGGLVAALEASPHELLAAVGVDMPFADPAVLRLCSELLTDEDAVVPVTPDGPQPLHAVYSRTAVPGLARALAEEHRSLNEALAGLHLRLVGKDEWGWLDPTGRFAFNLNRPEDLAHLTGATG